MLKHQTMKGLFKFIFLAICMLASLHIHATQLLSFQGKASDLKTSDLLYIENHKVILNEQGEYLSAYVTYSSPEGQIFAEKTLDYAKSSMAPDMLFHDKRSDEHIRVFLNDTNAYLQVLIEGKGKRKESNIKLDEPVIVVDAGFDRLIGSRWDVLRKDKEIQFTFLAITRAQLINFEAVEINVNDSSVFLELHPRNFFINMLVEPISLEYDRKTKRLMSFEGLTNIEKFENGKRTEDNYVARIEYSYESLKPFSAELSSLKNSTEEAVNTTKSSISY